MSRRSNRKAARRTAAAKSLTKPAIRVGKNDGWAVFGVCIFLAAITWIVFGQTLRHQFINVDDVRYVLHNPEVTQGLTIEGITWAFTHFYASNWHPLTWLSHMLDCQLYGLDPAGHHLTNVLLHISTAALLFLVLRQMTAALWRSAFVAAVFAVHPLHVESVAWVAERKDVLSGLFFVLTIAAYVRYVRRPWSPTRYGLVVLLFALGLMCKPMLITLPFVLLLLDYWPLNRVSTKRDRNHDFFWVPRQLLFEKLPLLGLAAVSCLVTIFAQKAAIQPLASFPFPLRVGNACIGSVAYLRQLFWPSDLAALYPFEVRDIAASAIVSLGLFAGISAGIFILRRPYLVVGWLWYLIMLAPVIGIVQVGAQPRADRYTYLPHIGLYLLVVWTAADLCAGLRHRHLFLGGLSAVILAALALTARTQTSYWRNSQSLWTHTIACTSDNPIARTNLGEAFYAKRQMNEAIAQYQTSLRIYPRQSDAHSALGVALLEVGRADESLAHLLTAVDIDPNNAQAHYNLANTFVQMGQVKEALIHYDRALEIEPHNIEALNNMAWLLATSADPTIRDGAKAVELAERANSLTGSTNSRVNATLATAYAETGRFSDAVKTAQRALELAVAQGEVELANMIRAHIEVYRANSPVRIETNRSQ
jgi:protein O-mannosyl-transferase